MSGVTGAGSCIRPAGSIAVPLTFDTGKRDALDECPLGKEEKHDHGHCQDRCHRHHPSPLNTHGADENLDPQR